MQALSSIHNADYAPETHPAFAIKAPQKNAKRIAKAFVKNARKAFVKKTPQNAKRTVKVYARNAKKASAKKIIKNVTKTKGTHTTHISHTLNSP